MANINRVELSGNLCREPIMRKTSAGVSVLTFSLGVSTMRRNKETGEWDSIPNYFDCVLFGNRADTLQNLLMKGTKIALCGELRWHSWEQDGSRRSKIDIVVDSIDLLEPRREDASHSAAPVSGANGYEVPAAAMYADSDIPF